jgi:putative redox protein
MRIMTTKPSKHSIVATPEGGARFSVRMRGHELLTDQPVGLGGTDGAPTPLELLGASLAACVALYVQRALESRSLSAEGLVVEARPVWRENPGRIGRYDVIVEVPSEIPVGYHAEIERAARNCPVHHTLVHGPELTVELRAPAAAAA